MLFYLCNLLFVVKIVMLVGWCAAIFFALSVVYGPYRAFKKNPVPFTKFENVLYGTFSRFAWGLALAWVTYACHLGLGGMFHDLNWHCKLNPLSYEILVSLSLC